MQYIIIIIINMQQCESEIIIIIIIIIVIVHTAMLPLLTMGRCGSLLLFCMIC